MWSYWCDINHLQKLMEGRCPNAALQTSGRLLSSLHPPAQHLAAPSSLYPTPIPTASQHLPHTSLNLRSKSSQKLKAQCSKGGDLESHAEWGWSRVCFYFFSLNFKWIHNSLRSMLSCLTSSHWEACSKLKSKVNINLLKSVISFWELEDTCKRITGQKPILYWQCLLGAKRIISDWEKTDKTLMSCQWCTGYLKQVS